MTETERIEYLKAQFDRLLREDLEEIHGDGTLLEESGVGGSMERPGIDTKPFRYKVVNGRARGLYF